MNFIPQKQRYKKQQKGKSFNRVNSVKLINSTQIEMIGLRTQSSGRVTSKQLLSFYKNVKKLIKKTGRIILCIYPQTPITKKPIEVRMGKGKGNVSFWVAKVKAGTTLCKIESNSPSLALKALIQAKQKISLKTKIIFNYGI